MATAPAASLAASDSPSLATYEKLRESIEATIWHLEIQATPSILSRDATGVVRALLSAASRGVQLLFMISKGIDENDSNGVERLVSMLDNNGGHTYITDQRPDQEQLVAIFDRHEVMQIFFDANGGIESEHVHRDKVLVSAVKTEFLRLWNDQDRATLLTVQQSDMRPEDSISVAPRRPDPPPRADEPRAEGKVRMAQRVPSRPPRDACWTCIEPHDERLPPGQGAIATLQEIRHRTSGTAGQNERKGRR